MQDVWTFGSASGVLELMHEADKSQRVYSFSAERVPGAIPLRITRRKRERLFSVTRACGVAISEWQGEGICAYTGIPRGRYLLSLGMLGLLRYRALQCNPLLHAEDLIHDTPAFCMYAHRLFAEEYALLFEKPQLCMHCRHFYSTLCPPEEVEALEQVLLHCLRPDVQPVNVVPIP